MLPLKCITAISMVNKATTKIMSILGETKDTTYRGGF